AGSGARAFCAASIAGNNRAKAARRRDGWNALRSIAASLGVSVLRGSARIVKGQRRFATIPRQDAASREVRIAMRRGRAHSDWNMSGASKKEPMRREPQRQKTGKRPMTRSGSRRILVVTIPPVDELDLVGPLQVFHSVNR